MEKSAGQDGAGAGGGRSGETTGGGANDGKAGPLLTSKETFDPALIDYHTLIQPLVRRESLTRSYLGFSV